MIVVIGGGISGLAAAYELSRRQLPCVVLEAGPRAGGLIRTEQVEGFTIDAGPDSLLTQKPAAIQLCQELGLGGQLMRSTPPRTAFVLHRGRLHALPSPSVLGLPASLGAVARYGLLGWRARARLALEPFVPRRKRADESVASFFRRRFGAATVGLIAEPLLGGIHAGDIEQLSMPALFPRLVDAEHRPGKVLHSLARNRQDSPDGLFRALRGGMGDLVAAIEGALPPGTVRVDSAALSLQRHAGGWHVESTSGAFDASGVIVAAPARVSADLVGRVDSEAGRICASVPYVSTASIAMGFRRGDVAHPLAGSGFVVARRAGGPRITACTWVSSKWEHRAPAGHVLLRTFVGGARDPHAVEASDAELLETALGDIRGVLGISAPPLLSRVFRSIAASAQHVVGHRARMAELQERLRAWPGLFVTGSGFDSIGIPDCVAHARKAAAAAADYATMAR